MEGGALDFFHRFECRLLCVALWSLAISFASGALWLWIEAAEMSGRSLTDALAPDVVGTLLRQTQFGHCWTLRVILVILIAALWPALPRMGKPNQSMCIGPRLIAGLLAGALLATLASVGHAAASKEPVRLFHLAADATHLLAAGVWPGGLVPFTMILARVHQVAKRKCRTTVYR
jgi:putative copper resistance protein D